MIVITGAGGQLGHAIALALSARVSPQNIGVSLRDPAKAADLAERGVRVRKGDFEDGASLDHAFEGATQVLLISSTARRYGGDALAQHRTAIDAAKRAGAKRILYTSHMGATKASLFPPMLDHTGTEDMLETCGVPWTSLRNGFYASSGIQLLGDAKTTGFVAAPADGKVSWTAHRDLAEATAAILANEGCFDGRTPPLTGGEALDLSDIAALAGVRRETIGDEAFAENLAKIGLPPVIVQISVGLYRAARAGEFSAVDPTLEKLIGRKPTTMRELLAG